MRYKEGVKMEGASVELIPILLSIQSFEFSKNGRELTVTSIRDGVHGIGSLHQYGKALDIRTRDDNSTVQWSDSIKKSIANYIKARLTNEYDVVIEDDHIHVEFDPR